MWKCAKICSHTIACAYQDKCLQEFLSRITDTPNFYALAKSGTPSNVGKKPHKLKACTKSSAKALSRLQEEVKMCPSLPATQSTAPVNLSTHSLLSDSRIQTNSVSLPSFSQSAPVTTSCTTVTSNPTNPTPEVAQSVSALLTYAPHCSVSVTQGAVSVSAAVIASPSPAVMHMSPSATYCTPSSVSSLDTSSTSTLSPNVIAANLVSKLISQLLSFSGSSNPGNATSMVNQATITSNVIDPHCLFWLMIVYGNISKCQGCSERIMRGSDGKPLAPPGDLVLQHKEQVLFQNPKTGNFQISHDLRNVYYHARFECIRRKYPTFNGRCISMDIQHHLTGQHKAYLAKEFGMMSL